MPYQIELFIQDGEAAPPGYPYGYILYEPEGSTRRPHPLLMQGVIFDADWDSGGDWQWWANRGLGPYEENWVQKTISADLAIEIKMKWTDPRLISDLEK